MERFEPRMILCPTDFSEPATLALRYAAEFARSSRSELLVIYADAFTPPPYFTSDQVDELVRVRRQAREDAELHLRTYVSNVLRDGPRHYATAVMEGNAVSTILRTALERKADLLVMGAHGETGFNRFMLGSVTERILRESGIPVLSVRTKRPDTTPAIRHILCPVNFSDVAMDAFRNAVDIAKIFGAELVVLHVVEAGADEVRNEELSGKLCAWVNDDFRNSCTLTHLVRKGNASEQILEVASSGPCDLIVLGVQHKRFFDTTVIGSTTARVAGHAPCPVLAVPGKKP